MDSLCLHPRHEQFVHGERATFRAFVSAGLAGVGIGGVTAGLMHLRESRAKLDGVGPAYYAEEGERPDLLNQVMGGTRIRGP